MELRAASIDLLEPFQHAGNISKLRFEIVSFSTSIALQQEPYYSVSLLNSQVRSRNALATLGHDGGFQCGKDRNYSG